jgi:hypothetical protein
MSLSGFFCPRMLESEFTFHDLACGLGALVALIWLAGWWQHKRTGQWGWGRLRLALLIWVILAVVMAGWHVGEILLFPGHFVEGLEGHDGYVTTTTNTPNTMLHESRLGFQINVLHFSDVHSTSKPGHPVIGQQIDYVRHAWISAPQYVQLMIILREQKLPFPPPDGR